MLLHCVTVQEPLTSEVLAKCVTCHVPVGVTTVTYGTIVTNISHLSSNVS
jgi:hypothetical protein